MDLRRTDLPLLVSLRALVSARSVTGAANEIGISQPAMSAQLARLRDLFKDQLLVGNARGMVPTRRAEQLADQINDPLGQLNRIINVGAGFNPETSRETIRIAGSEHTNAVIGTPLIARLATIAPNMRLALYAFQPSRAAAQFAENDLDLALLTPSMSPKDMHMEHLFDDHLVVVRRKTTGDKPAPTLESYCAERHILVSTTGGSFSATVDDVLAEKGMKRKVAASVQSFSVALQMVATSDLITTLPHHYTTGWRDIIKVEDLPFKAPFSFHMVWSKRVASDPKRLWLCEQIRAIAQELNT